MFRFTRLAAVWLTLAVAAFAQSERGTISGIVRDSTGAVVPAAQVTVTSAATNAASNLTTNDAGEFKVPNLSVGNYSVRVEKPGFRSSLIRDINLNAASEVRADVTLEVGSATTQTVERGAVAHGRFETKCDD